MNLPNFLTLSRIFLVPLLVAALVQEDRVVHLAGVAVTNEIVALVIFLAAAATDLLDGYLARKWSQITTVGTLLDPVADKLLISAALIALVQVQQIPAWMVILIVCREFAVSGFRAIAATAGYTIEASDLGKTKMISQVIAIALVLLSDTYPSLKTLANIWLWGVVLFAVASAVDYFRKFWKKVDLGIKARRRREILQARRRARRQKLA